MTNSNTISEPEQLRRRESIDFARASIGLEGFTISEAMEAHAQRFVNGEIDLEEFVSSPGTHQQSSSALEKPENEPERHVTAMIDLEPPSSTPAR